MATQVVSNQQQNNNTVNVDGSTDNLSGGSSAAALGPSYANAVSKLTKGNRDSDKENISDYHVGVIGALQGRNAAGAKDYNVINKMTCPKASSQYWDEAMAVGSSPQDEGDSFTTVTNHHSRKERKKEERHTAKRQVNKPVNGVQSQKEQTQGAEEKRHGEKGGNISAGNGSRPVAEQDQEPVTEKKVFVEAPLPKVNPWQANRNAAQVLLGPQQNEKRVLQNISGASTHPFTHRNFY